MLRTLLAGLTMAMAFGSAVAQADEDQSRRIGDVEIFYAAIPTSQLPDAILKRYGLKGGNQRGLMQVTVRRHAADGSDRAIDATVSGIAQSLTGRPLNLSFTRKDDGGEAVYLAEFALIRPDTYRYTLQVAAEGLPSQQISFQRDYAPE